MFLECNKISRIQILLDTLNIHICTLYSYCSDNQSFKHQISNNRYSIIYIYILYIYIYRKRKIQKAKGSSQVF